MGAYLSRPVTTKDSIEGQNDWLRFAATSMQGWRVSQEDAHNCLENFIDGWSMFSIYDGHGGCEVSEYTAQMLPDLIRVSDFAKADDVTTTLQDVFIKFDEHLRSATAIEKMAAITKASAKENGNEDCENISGEVKTILDEARLPIHEILAKYGFAMLKQPSATKKRPLVQEINDGDTEEEIANGDQKEKKGDQEDVVDEARPISLTENPIKRAKLNDDEKSEELPKGTINGMETNQDATEEKKPKDEKPADSEQCDKAEVADDDDTSDEEFEDESDEDEEMSDECEDSDEEGIDDFKSFPMAPSMISDGDNQVAGVDSGTTACVCLVGKEKIIVANIGDSRAVLCRSGTAIDLSSDHKPEDAIEKERIQAAGGVITDDGRVCGGLNLSRALGDHFYKKVETLPLARQMISALPDVTIQTLTPEDEFLVVACDGIWNSMSSQEVVKFVKDQLDSQKPLKDIVEELCDSCLAENSGGDGTGCDNMTCIIVDLRKPATKDTVEESTNGPTEVVNA